MDFAGMQNVSPSGARLHLHHTPATHLSSSARAMLPAVGCFSLPHPAALFSVFYGPARTGGGSCIEIVGQAECGHYDCRSRRQVDLLGDWPVAGNVVRSLG